MKKYYLDQVLVDCLLSQGADLKQDTHGYYIEGWTQGVASIDLHNRDNCATYLCWYDSNMSARGVKAYFNQFTEA